MAELLSLTGLSVSELARKVGVSRQAIWAYGAGVTIPQFATVLKLADVGEKPLSFFVAAGSGVPDIIDAEKSGLAEGGNREMAKRSAPKRNSATCVA